MNSFERDYLATLKDVINKGNVKGDRTNTGTLSKFAQMIRVSLKDNVAPLLFSKQIFNRSYIIETLWFLSGSTDIKFLKDNGVGIWDEWVIPSTAVFREYTQEEYVKAYAKKFTGKTISPGFTVSTYKEVFNWMRCTLPEAYELWRKTASDNPTLIELTTFLHTEMGITTIPNIKLVSGNIGVGAYGSLWRKWEDTRIVDQKDEQKYYDRGYRYIVSVPRAANFQRGVPGAPEDHIVVHRTIDQIANAIKLLKNNPDSRRIIVTAWNPGRIEDASLPPCHSLFSFYTSNISMREIESQMFESNSKDFIEWTKIYEENFEDKVVNKSEIYDRLCKFAVERGYKTKKLSCFLYQRSSDVCLGLPFNVAQYVLLTNMIAQVCNMEPDEFVWVGADTHVYANHVELAKEQVTCDHEKSIKPKFVLNPEIKNIDDFKISDIKIEGYEGYNKPIPYPVAV